MGIVRRFVNSLVPRRSWFRFSLRSMAILTLLAAVGFAYETHQLRRRQHASTLLEGGTWRSYHLVGYCSAVCGPEVDGKPIPRPSPPTPADPPARQLGTLDRHHDACLRWLVQFSTPRAHYGVTCFSMDGDPGREALAALGCFDELEDVHLAGSSIDNSVATSWSGWKNLKSLHLKDTSLGDEGMAVVASLDRLQRVEIESRQITTVGLAELSKLPWLRELTLVGARLTRHDPPVCGRFVNLAELRVRNCEIDSDGLLPLLGAPILAKVVLEGCHIDPDGLAALAQSAWLTEIEIIDCRLVESEFQYLSDLPQLYELRLQGSAIDDHAIRQLGQAPRLVKVVCVDTSVTGAGFQAFHDDSPLWSVTFSGCPLDSLGLAQVWPLRNLHYVSISNCEMADADLESLLVAPALELIQVRNTAITPLGVLALFQRKPDLRVINDLGLDRYSSFDAFRRRYFRKFGEHYPDSTWP